MKTRLIIFEVDTVTGCRSVYDIIEFDGRLSLPELVKKLPSVRRSGESVAQSREHWKYVLEDLGTTDRPFVIERVPDPMDKYDHCLECDGQVPSTTAAYARRRFEQYFCSTACRQKHTLRAYACCDKAVQVPCVCTYATECPDHGTRHNGTHD